MAPGYRHDAKSRKAKKMQHIHVSIYKSLYFLGQISSRSTIWLNYLNFVVSYLNYEFASFLSLGSILELGCDVDVEDFPKKTWLMDKQRRIGGDALSFILGVGQA